MCRTDTIKSCIICKCSNNLLKRTSLSSISYYICEKCCAKMEKKIDKCIICKRETSFSRGILLDGTILFVFICAKCDSSYPYSENISNAICHQVNDECKLFYKITK